MNSKKIFLIAEIGINHNGDINNAYKIIDMAKACGADAVKLQTYRPDTITIDIDSKEDFFTYRPKYIKDKKISKKSSKNNLFDKLSELRFR